MRRLNLRLPVDPDGPAAGMQCRQALRCRSAASALPNRAPVKTLPPEMPFLLRGAVSRRVHVELFPYDFLIDHPHNRPIRRNGRLGTFLGQNPHQYPLESQHGRLLILPAALLPGIRLRRGTASRRGMPVPLPWVGIVTSAAVKRPSGRVCASPSHSDLSPEVRGLLGARHSLTLYLPGTLIIASQLVQRRFRAAACRR